MPPFRMKERSAGQLLVVVVAPALEPVDVVLPRCAAVRALQNHAPARHPSISVNRFAHFVDFLGSPIAARRSSSEKAASSPSRVLRTIFLAERITPVVEA